MTQFQWREAIVLDNWQLVELPQSEGREFDPRQVHDNLSVPLWVYMRCMYVCMYACMYACMHACLGPRVQILHSAEEHNLSPFDLNMACLCQSIEINNNKYVYRQSQVRKSTESGVKWAECSLIIGTGCRVQVFSLILDSSVGLSASIQSAGDLVSGWDPGFKSCIQQRNTTCLLSI